jgi:hypothetical protein
MASPVLSQQPLRICLSLPLANTEGETQAVIKVAFFQLVLIRLPFIRSEVTTNVEHPFGRYGDGIVGSLYTFFPPACKARVYDLFTLSEVSKLPGRSPG